MTTPANNKRVPPNINMPEDMEVSYANLARISHTPSEIILDFARMLPNEPDARVTARVLMSPLNAKLFHLALGENLARYEAAFGEIKLQRQSTLADNLFRPLNPPNPDTEKES